MQVIDVTFTSSSAKINLVLNILSLGTSIHHSTTSEHTSVSAGVTQQNLVLPLFNNTLYTSKSTNSTYIRVLSIDFKSIGIFAGLILLQGLKVSYC